jgi:hypothetical protein
LLLVVGLVDILLTVADQVVVVVQVDYLLVMLASLLDHLILLL